MEYEFNVGTAFPASDPAARWVVQLAMIRNDLGEAFRQTQKFQDSGDSARAIYYYKLLNAHLREAIKFIQFTRTEVSGFIDTLPQEVAAALAAVDQECKPWATSFVNTELVPIRIATFHYEHEDPQKVIDAMTNAASLPGRVVANQDGDLRYEFADQIALHLVFPRAREDQEAYEQTTQRLADLAATVLNLTGRVVTEYLLGLGGVVTARR